MSSSGEVYGAYILPDRFNADILLPNGLFVTIPCKREYTLETIKKELWQTINSSVLKFFDIGDQSSFIFSAITYDGREEAFYHESRRICDLRLFDLTLKLIEPEGNKEEKRFNSMIDIAIGKKVSELILDLPRDIRDEVTEFRKGKHDYEPVLLDQINQGLLFSSYSNFVDVPFKLRIISATYVNVRNVDSIFVRVAVYHGTDCLDVKESSQVEPSNPKWDQWVKFDFHCTELPRSAKICLSICVVNKKKPKLTYAIGCINFSVFNYRGFMRSGKMQLNLWPAPKDSDELLFPLGVMGNNPNKDSASLLLEFQSFDRHIVFAPIRDIYAYAAHAIGQEPTTIDRDSIQLSNILSNQNQQANQTGNTFASNNQYTHYSSIRVDFRDRTLSNSCADTRAFIERRLSASSNARRDSVSTNYNENVIGSLRSRRPTANSDKFSAPSSRTSSTASMLVRLDSNANSKLNSRALALNSCMSNNNQSNVMSHFSASSSSIILAQQGLTTSPISSPINLPIPESPVLPGHDDGASSSLGNLSSVSLEGDANSVKSAHSIQQLSSNTLSSRQQSSAQSDSPSVSCATSSMKPKSEDLTKEEEENIKLVNELIATPPFTPLNAQQKSLLWSMRFYCKRIPESLPKLLDAIDWKSRNQISQLYVLLDEWGQVNLETALRLLDVKYEDKYVRQHAVKWLDHCIDEEMLACYLLQFIQVLKTEPYLDNELSSFLNNRALLSPHIGNLFFWYIRSECDELGDYHNTIRFRYLLERYLKGLSEQRLSILTRQVHGIDKLMILAEALKFSKEVGASREEKIKFMQTQLQRVDFTDVLQNIPDPVNCKRFLGEILFDDCRIMDSAKRPLWLVWSLPIFTDERKLTYPDNPQSEADVMRRASYTSKRSYSYSGTKDQQSAIMRPEVSRLQTSKSIKEDDSCQSSQENLTTSRFSSRTMTSSSDSAKGVLINSSSSVANASPDMHPGTLTKSGSMSSSNGSTNINGVPVATSAIIFKVGDDLRQDMLTLQIIRIVDNIWRSEGLDMCMLAYTCLATGKNVGIIEVVNRAETITSIQKSGGRMATIQIDSTHLHRWIKERNNDNYDKAIERFTRSCAGYSVLTFVLGIADRNPDNIMVSEDGRIFHIDFGHFLGHFKKKFGINRERVPFVLTDDFLHVIARGSHARKTGSFDTFKDLCLDAYLSLRRQSNLLITLFTMMLRTGIPELRSIDDISYLKTSLQVGSTEAEAREFFHTQFFEAYYGAWATKVDWFFHNITRM